MKKATKYLPFALLLFIKVCAVAQSGFWIPPKTPSASDSDYEFSVNTIQLAESALLDNNTSDYWNKVHRHNLFLAYLQLDAPKDTIAKYFNSAMAFSIDYSCQFLLKNGSSFENMIRRHDAEIWNIYDCRCKHLFSTYDSMLIRTLDTIYRDDQEIREQLDNNNSKIIKGTHQHQNLWKEQTKRDSINQVKIQKIIPQKGYPGRRLVGNQYCDVAFNVIQHAPLDIQEKYLYLIQIAAQKDEIEQYLPAYLTDRIKMRKGEKQIFGTQFIYNSKAEKMELYPVEHMSEVDTRRISVGLPPLSVELKKYGLEKP